MEDVDGSSESFQLFALWVGLLTKFTESIYFEPPSVFEFNICL